MRGVIAECEYAPGLPFRIRYLRTSDTNFERTVRVLSYLRGAQFFRPCARQGCSGSVIEPREPTATRRDHTNSLQFGYFFAMLLAARSFAVSRVAVVARPSRFAREGAPSGFASASPRRVIKSKESQGASLSDTQQDRGSVEHALPSGVALGRAIAARCLSCIIVIAHSLHAATSGVPTQGGAIRIIS